MKKLLLAVVTVLGVFVLVACGGGESTGLYDDDGNEITELRIGLLIDEGNPEAGRASSAFRDAMSEAIGIPVVEIEGVSHLIGLEAMRGGSLDLMVASGFTFLTAEQMQLEVEFLAMQHNPDAEPASTVFITAAENTHIQTIADFEGESFAFVDTASMTGFLLPMYELVSTLDRDHTQMLNPGYFFSATILSGAHDASVMAAANGDVAGAAVVSVFVDNVIASGIIDEDSIRIVHALEPQGSGGYMVRSSLPQSLIDDLRTFLLEFDDEEFFATIQGSPNARFIPHDPAELTHLRSLMERLEIGQE